MPATEPQVEVLHVVRQVSAQLKRAGHNHRDIHAAFLSTMIMEMIESGVSQAVCQEYFSRSVADCYRFLQGDSH